MLEEPSPKLQNQPVIAELPAIDKSVNWTVRGAWPDVG